MRHSYSPQTKDFFKVKKLYFIKEKHIDPIRSTKLIKKIVSYITPLCVFDLQIVLYKTLEENLIIFLKKILNN